MRIQNKLFVAFLLAGISLVALMFFLVQWSLTQGLLEFINTKERDNIAPLVEVLKKRYQSEQGWGWIDKEHRLFHDLYRDNTKSHRRQYGGPPRNRRPPPHRIHDGPQQWDDGPYAPPQRKEDHSEMPTRGAVSPLEQGEKEGPRPNLRRGPGQNERPTDLSLFNQDKQFLAGRPHASEQGQWLAIKVDDKAVGYLVIPRRLGVTQGIELTLLEQQRNALIIISLILMCLTILIAMPLARNLVDPIKKLAKSMDLLTKGDYKTRVVLKRNDELGHLSRGVNELAMTLEKNDSARRRWIANISHELRTPIAVMKGEMEAVIDGVRPLSLDYVGSSHQEVQRLQRLVEDLYELSSSDIGGMKYRKEEFDLVELVEDELGQYQQILSNANIKLTDNLSKKPLNIWADADRLCQLFNNLMVNCAKYADTDGHVKLSLQPDESGLKLTIEDNGKGVPEQHLDNLFEHLYRVDDSRARTTGGSGLGLAICKQIVEAHNGSIHAQKSELGGLAIVICLETV